MYWLCFFSPPWISQSMLSLTSRTCCYWWAPSPPWRPPPSRASLLLLPCSTCQYYSRPRLPPPPAGDLSHPLKFPNNTLWVWLKRDMEVVSIPWVGASVSCKGGRKSAKLLFELLPLLSHSPPHTSSLSRCTVLQWLGENCTFRHAIPCGMQCTQCLL